MVVVVVVHDAVDNDDSSLAGSQLTIRVFRRGRRISKTSETGFLIRGRPSFAQLVDKTDLVKRFFPLERRDDAARKKYVR